MTAKDPLVVQYYGRKEVDRENHHPGGLKRKVCFCIYDQVQISHLKYNKNPYRYDLVIWMRIVK